MRNQNFLSISCLLPASHTCESSSHFYFVFCFYLRQQAEATGQWRLVTSLHSFTSLHRSEWPGHRHVGVPHKSAGESFRPRQVQRASAQQVPPSSSGLSLSTPPTSLHKPKSECNNLSKLSKAHQHRTHCTVRLSLHVKHKTESW